MTAAHILSRWRRVRGVVKTYTMWFTLLNIAEAGGVGITRATLAESTGLRGPSLTHSLRIMRKAGLVTERLGERTGRASPPTISTITPKGLEFLGLKPSP